MPTRRISQSIQIGDQTLSGSVLAIGSMAVSIEEACAGSGNIAIAQTIDVSALKAIFVTVTGPLTIDFNGPDLEIYLDTNYPFCWFQGNDMPNPFGSTDVTSIDVVNEESSAATVKIEIVTDATP